MNQNNAIRSLHRTNDATAQAIMQQYPPQWDMDRVFRKAYQGYLAQKNDSLQAAVPFSSEVTETVEYTPENSVSRRIRRFSGYAGIAAAMVGVFLLIAKTNSLHTPVDRIPDETNPSTTAETTEVMPETTYESTGESGFIPVFTEGSASETTASTMESTNTETIPTQTEAFMTEVPASGTAVIEITTSVTTEATAESTTETTATETTPTTQSHGQFIIEDPTSAAASYTIRYARESDVPVEKHEHDFEAEGFTLTQKTEYNEQYDFHSTYYSLQDGNGQNYAVNQFQYDYFSTTCNPGSGDLMKQYTIGGKSAILLYQEDPDALCRLIWDDGCHVCVMYSQYKDLANMEILLQSQTGEKIVVPEFESYFKMEEPASGGSGRIVYVLGSSDPVQERTHSFAAEGFTLTDVTDYNAGQPYHSTNYTLTDENGQQYLIMQEQYQYFAASYDPDAVPLTKSYTIGGKNVFLVYEDNLDSVCRLMWDDGCHICTVMSQYKDLAKMELLVQSQITE